MKKIYEFIQTLCIITVVLLSVVTIAKVSMPTPPNYSGIEP